MRSTLAAPRSALRVLLALAWRESRTARRRLLLYMSSIALGVAALVAIDSFASNVAQSARTQSRALLGGDLSFGRNSPMPKPVSAWLDSLAERGAPVARQVTFASMGLVPRTGGTRLVQVRAVSASLPLYGEVTTQPAGRWAQLQTGPHALVDRSLLVALDADVGDTLVLGYTRFAIIGALENVPGDPGIAAVLGPRVYIPERYLAETHLLGFGARARSTSRSWRCRRRRRARSCATCASASIRSACARARWPTRSVVSRARSIGSPTSCRSSASSRCCWAAWVWRAA
ncbi:ABC transporter permease [Gemmatirosa kalamazoonensis]|uniref:ABC transporter permease n=1 Tax=Gemmatirosa kalamazoonensis TaxID=861299 RepID=UPI0011DE4F0C|nr:ABC transporter permease [Gemmatirosa kalamazoonensis]